MSVYYVVLDLISASSGHAVSERASDRCTLPLAVGNQDSSSGLALITRCRISTSRYLSVTGSGDWTNWERTDSA